VNSDKALQPTGRDQKNLLYFPIGVTGKNQPRDKRGQIAEELQHTVRVYDADVGREVDKALTIRTASKYHFCTGYELGI